MSSLATGWVCFVQLIQGMFVRGWCSQVTAGASAVFVPMGVEAGRGRLWGDCCGRGGRGLSWRGTVGCRAWSAKQSQHSQQQKYLAYRSKSATMLPLVFVFGGD